MRTLKLLIIAAAVAAAACLVGTAGAGPPLHEGPFSFPVHVDDFFAGGPGCDFAVVGDWTATANDTAYTDEAGNIVKTFTRIDFTGTLRNAETGASIPDAGIILLWDYYAPDGTFLREVEHHTRFNPLLHAAFRAIVDDTGNVVFDVGRDWIPFNRHPISVEPVCEALT
jgi:hypothetical protein